mmetsp:Transcript_72588/g.200237  ORF Transcript_72588/g.200237 Transcript_72588/m.200237 type:complete len:410 (+) Transcript_72588:58-1287(+)
MDASTALNGLQRLVNFHLGGSLYLMPFIFAAAGPACAIAMLVACALLTLIVYELIAGAALRTRKGSFGNIVERSLGAGCAALLRLMVALNAMGVVLAYSQTVVDVYAAAGGQMTVEGAWFIGTLVVGLAVSVGLDIFLGHIADWGSAISNAALLALVFLFAVCPWVERTDCQAVVRSETWKAAVLRFAHSLIFAFTSAEYVLYACNVADDDGNLIAGKSDGEVHKQVKHVGGASLLLSSFLYISIGYLGFQTFGSCVAEDVLSNLAPRGAPAGWARTFAVVLALNALSLVLSFPVFVQTLLLYLREFSSSHVPGRFSAPLQAFFDPERTWRGAAWVVPLAGVAVHHLPGLQWIIDLVCSWTDVFFMFVFPPLMFILKPLVWSELPTKVLATLMLLAALGLNFCKWYELM